MAVERPQPGLGLLEPTEREEQTLQRPEVEQLAACLRDMVEGQAANLIINQGLRSESTGSPDCPSMEKLERKNTIIHSLSQVDGC
jgi:hypothetical protein